MLNRDALQGSLPLLVLKILDRRGPLHGYAITSQIESFSDLLRVEKVRFTRRSTAWKKPVGSAPSGPSPKTSAAPASTKSPSPDVRSY